MIPANHVEPSVISGITRFEVDDTNEDFELWVEGVSWGGTTISLNWNAVEFDSVLVTVVGVDLDIDSDNNDGFGTPERSVKEEFLEDNLYGLGKLVMQNHATANPALNYTKAVVELPRELPMDTPLRIRLDYPGFSPAGQIWLWLKDRDDPTRDGSDASTGGDFVQAGSSYNIYDLGYSPGTGLITIYVAGLQENLNIKKLKGIEINGKPQEYIKATLHSIGDLATDRVKFIVAQEDSFYYRLQFSESLRAGIASSRVYGGPGATATTHPADSVDYSQEKLSREQLLKLGIDNDSVLSYLTEPQANGFKATIYRDYISDMYFIAYAGTEFDWGDVVADLATGATGWIGGQFGHAISIGRSVVSEAIPNGHSFVTVGHSLGGGLASATAVAGGGYIRGVTFNAMGLPLTTVALICEAGSCAYDATLVTAYWVDWDLLSNSQDHIDATILDPMASAFGIREKLDGPFDGQMSYGIFIGIIASFWSLQRSELFDAIQSLWNHSHLQAMVKSHNRGSYLYGLLVKENWPGAIVEDLLGYSPEDLDAGRAP